MSEQKEVRGYKVFNPDWTCRGFQYKVGENKEIFKKMTGIDVNEGDEMNDIPLF